MADHSPPKSGLVSKVEKLLLDGRQKTDFGLQTSMQLIEDEDLNDVTPFGSLGKLFQPWEAEAIVVKARNQHKTGADAKPATSPQETAKGLQAPDRLDRDLKAQYTIREGCYSDTFDAGERVSPMPSEEAEASAALMRASRPENDLNLHQREKLEKAEALARLYGVSISASAKQELLRKSDESQADEADKSSRGNLNGSVVVQNFLKSGLPREKKQRDF